MPALRQGRTYRAKLFSPPTRSTTTEHHDNHHQHSGWPSCSNALCHRRTRSYNRGSPRRILSGPAGQPGKLLDDPDSRDQDRDSQTRSPDVVYFRSTHSSNAFYIPVSIPLLTTEPVHALVDSGASANFIDPSLIPSSANPQQLENPIILELFDGSIASRGLITHQLTLPTLFPHGILNQLTFLVTTLHPTNPLVLGFPWLHEHDPDIDWKQLRLRTPPPDPVSSKTELQEIPVEDQIAINVTLGRGAAADNPIDIKLINSAAMELLSRQGEEVYQIFTARILDCAQGLSSSLSVLSTFSPEERQTFEDTVPEAYHDFADVFSEQEATRLPPHRPYDHAIDLDDGTTPPFGPIYSLSENETLALRQYLEENLQKGFIRPSNSPAGAPILFVKKKDGSLRLCVDYRGLNKITRKNRYPLPLIGDLLDQLKDARVFTKLDLRAGYNNIRIASGHEWKTAFRTRYGSFEYLVMPFGMTNSPATFQHFMNDIFRDMADQFVVVYLDDILIYSREPTQHAEHVRLVLQRLREFDLHIKMEKCLFHTDTVEYLGFIVSPAGVTMDKAKTEVIRTWPAPRNVKEVQSFLGFANFYRRFINDYSRIVRPLTNLTRKDVPFTWSDKCFAAFNTLKAAFDAAPVLTHFDPQHHIIVETDASDYAISAILSQIKPEDNDIHPIAFHSRTMTPAEINYDIYDKELLAIVDCFTHWRNYLEGSHHTVQVFSDHQNLTTFLDKKQLNRRQSRWSQFLARFDFHINHRAGKLGTKPDALTRRRDVYPRNTDGTYAQANAHNIQSLLRPEHLFATFLLDSTVLNAQLLAGLMSDPVAQSKLTELALADPNNTSKYSKDDQGHLLYEGRLYVPDTQDLRLLLTQAHHDHALAGHPGVRKTIQLLRRRYWWPGMQDFVTNFILSCDQCKRAKATRHKPYGHLRFLPIPNRPWSSISMDFIEGLPDSRGFDCILVIVDRLTKMSLFIPTRKTLDTPDLANLFLTHVFSKHGTPSDIVSDRGKHFVSRFWSSLCSLLGIKSNLSTAYHPETDGQTERINQILEQYLRIYINYQQDDWADLLPLAEFAYNNTTHSATGVSPFFANKGYHPAITVELLDVPSTQASQVATDLDGLHQHLKDQLEVTLRQYATATQTRRSPNPAFEPGTRVWLDARNIRTRRPMKKLDHKRLGPFTVLDVVSTHARRLELPPSLNAIHNVFHVSLLEPHHPNPYPTRTTPPPPTIEVDGDIE